MNPGQSYGRLNRSLSIAAWLGSWFSAAAAAATNAPAAPLASGLPDVTFSLFRILGALALVFALFLGGVWLFRNWQRLTVRPGRAPRLNVVESRALGARHTLHVVGYEQQRMLLATSPAGVTFLSALPEAEPGEIIEPTPVHFRAVFEELLQRKA